MTSRSRLIFAGIMTLSMAALAQACSASGGGDQGSTGDDTTGTDSGSQTIDGGPVLSDGSTPADSAVTDSAVPFDAGACVFTPPSEKCGIFPQCGCPATTCDFVPDGGDLTACTASVGAAAGGAACSSSLDCEVGLTCTFGRCRAFCETPGATCTGAEYGLCHNHAGIAAFNICGIACDLANASSCGGTQGCEPVSAGSLQTTECENVGTGTTGAACTNPVDCKPGFNCVNNGVSQVCEQFCKVTGGTCITGTCESLAPAIMINGVEYGSCQ